MMMMTRSKSGKNSTNVTKLASVKKLITRKKNNKNAETKKSIKTTTKDDENKYADEVRARSGECIGKITILKTTTKSTTAWLSMLMDAYPQKELEEFYREYLCLSSEAKIDIAECIKMIDDNDDKWEKSVDGKCETKSQRLPYRQSNFFGFIFSSGYCGTSHDFEKRIKFNEFSQILTRVSRMDVGRNFYNFGQSNKKNIIVELFLKK